LKNYSKYSILMILLSSILLSACTKNDAPVSTSETRDTLYQVSTINSLMAGNYDGIESVTQISKKGDFGIGTFDSVDGEMVMLNGIIYQIKASGKVETPDGAVKLPFSAVTYFDVDTSQDVTQVQNLDALKAVLDKMIVKKDRFYAIKVDGLFSQIKARSVPKQQKPFPILSEVTKKQAVFNYENVKGTLVGFWCPDYVGSVNVPGYHLHFISDDRTKGGHLLDVSFSNANIQMDESPFFQMELGENTQQVGGIKDTQGEIDKVEK
jgi:acetolactate decarboxylase